MQRKLAIGVMSWLVLAAAAHGGKFNKVLSVGDAAPGWSGLLDLEGREHSLKDLKDAKAVVLVFTSNRCPVAAGYDARLAALHREFRDQGAVFVAIVSSDDPGEQRGATRERARQSGLEFTFLQDPRQTAARAHGALCTPHVFLLDGERKIAYMGAVDDDNDAGAARRHYLREAIEAVLAGKPVKTAETRPRGCAIQYAEK